MRRDGVDVAAGAVVVVLAVATALGATRFPGTSGAVPGPGLFPLLLAVLWFPLGVALIVSGLRASTSSTPAVGSWNGGRLFGLAVAYVVLMPLAGFVTASALYLLAAITMLGYRKWWRAAAVALSIAFLVFWIFSHVMKVPLPDGWLG